MNDPNIGYRRQFLWIPKSAPGVQNLKPSLTFRAEGTVVRAYSETPTHLLVPREYIPINDWESMDFPIVDETPQTFPIVQVQCKATFKDVVQQEAHDALLQHGNGILTLACGKGKTVVSLMAWCDLGVPALVVVPTEELMNQWLERIKQFTDLKPSEIGLYKGAVSNWKKPITLTTIQTLAARIEAGELPDGFSDHFGVVIYDEVHRLGAPFFNLTAAVGKGFRWGLSATPGREDGLDALYQYHIGKVIYQNLEQDIVPLTLFVRTGVNPTLQELSGLVDSFGDIDLVKVKSFLASHEGRNALIRSVTEGAVRDGRRILELSDRIEQLDTLASMFPQAGKIHGEVPKKQRAVALQNHDLVFASTQLAKEGLDKPQLDTVMVLLPLGGEGAFRQILGRIQRAHEDKRAPLVFIFEDEKIGICVGLCKKLRRHLAAFGYPFQVITWGEQDGN